MRAWIKLLVFFMCIFIFMLINGTISMIVWDKWRRLCIKTKILQFFSGLGLVILGVKVQYNASLEKVDRAELIVANHLSYLDILVIASRIPTAFVTSVEIKHTPFLGQLTQIAGCLYVERRNKNNIGNEIDELREGLSKNINITIFPEATSTNGEQVLRFKRPLFKSAIMAEKMVHPLCLNYLSIDKKILDKKNRDAVFWYGDMQFFSHILDMCKLTNIEVELKSLEKIYPTDILDLENIAEKSHNLIASHYIPVF